MVTLYEKLRRKKEAIKELTIIGVVSPVWIRDIEIFESYSDLPENLCCYCKHEVLAEKYKISADRVKRIVSKLAKC